MPPQTAFANGAAVFSAVGGKTGPVGWMSWSFFSLERDPVYLIKQADERRAVMSRA
jgi:hypothetical protein